jgi:hypothetical protein
MAILVAMVLGNGQTVMFMKATLEMAFNLAKEHFNAKKVVGLIQVNGSKAK